MQDCRLVASAGKVEQRQKLPAERIHRFTREQRWLVGPTQPLLLVALIFYLRSPKQSKVVELHYLGFRLHQCLGQTEYYFVQFVLSRLFHDNKILMPIRNTITLNRKSISTLKSRYRHNKHKCVGLILATPSICVGPTVM